MESTSSNVNNSVIDVDDKNEGPIPTRHYDRFFYKMNQETDKTTVTFLSTVLFSLYSDKMKADFSLPDDVEVYQFSSRFNKKKNMVSLYMDTRKLEVFGQNHTQWISSRFDNAILSLMPKLVNATNEKWNECTQISDTNNTISLETPLKSSTPSMRQANPTNTSTEVIDTMFKAISALQGETEMLRLEMNNMKQQTYATITSSRTESANASIEPADINNTNQQSSETQHLAGDKSQALLMPNTSSQQEIGVMIGNRNSDRMNNNIERHGSNNSTHQSPRNRILLIGDSILNGVNPKGLKHNVHKHAIPGATLNILLRDINLYDLKTFDTVILYCGGNDLSKTTDHELIEERYDQLVSIIRSANPECKILLSKLAPRGDVDVNIVNMIIERLTLHHNCEYVDNFRSFHDKNGAILLRFLNQNDHIHLTPSGTKRLLGTINNIVNIVHNFDKCTMTPNNPQSDYNRYEHPRLNHSRRLDQSRRHNDSFDNSFSSYYRDRRPRSTDYRARKCLNCNDTSHITSECRHSKPIKCWECGLIGHKQERCWNLF